MLFIIFASLFGVLIAFQNNFAGSNPIAAQSQSLSVSINPSGPVQLQLDQSQIFIANVSHQDAPLKYFWSVENSSDISAINGTNYLLETSGNQAVFKFLTAINICWLSVIVNSAIMTKNATVKVQYVTSPPVKQISQQPVHEQANQQTSQPQTTQTAPSQNKNLNYTNSNNNLASTTSYFVTNDGKGNYQVVNTTNGETIKDYTSTSANITLNKAIASGGVIAIGMGNYSGAKLIVPPTANIIAEQGVTGIEYASIADGAKIDEPAFNSAFGRYTSGNYTVVTNSNTIATSETWYLAFKPDSSIYFASTKCGLVMRRIIATNPSEVVLGSGSFTWSALETKTIQGASNRCVIAVTNISRLSVVGAGIWKTKITIPVNTSEAVLIGDNAWNITFSDMSFYQPDNVTTGNIFGLTNSVPSGNIVMKNIFFDNIAQDPITIQDAAITGLYVQNNIMTNCRRNGFSTISASTYYLSNLWITNNVITGLNNSNVGILYYSNGNVSSVHISNNTISNFGYEGIETTSLTKSEICRNIIFNNSQIDGRCSGIYLSYSQNNTVQDNIVYNQYTGYREYGTSDFNLIVGNDFSQNRNNSTVVGLNNIITGNLGIG
jgi:parallel beta-helix repeat protein